MYIIVLTIGIILLSIGYCGHNKHEFHIGYIGNNSNVLFLIVNTIWVWLVGIMNQPTVGNPSTKYVVEFWWDSIFPVQRKKFYGACWGDTDNLRRIGSVLHDLHARGHETHNVQIVYVWHIELCLGACCCARGTWLMCLSTFTIHSQ
jgi:hypothetical protein